MRGFVWVVFGVTGCGSVAATPPLPDAPPGAIDASAIDASTIDGSVIDAPPAAPGSVRWVRSLSSLQGLGIQDGAGGLVVTGDLTTPADLGGGTLTPSGGAALVVAGFDAETAAHLYSVDHGGAGAIFPFLHALNASGAPIVNGVSYGDVDLGKGPVLGGVPVTDPVRADGYIGLYGTGAPGWVSRIVGAGEDKIVATAPGPGSTVYGAGWFEDSATFNGGTLTSAGGRDLFLARFNTFTGAVDLTATFGGTGRDEISTAARSGNDLVVAGMFDDTLSFGGTSQPITSASKLDIWVAKLGADGKGVWAVRYGGTGDDRDPQIAVDAAGDIYIAGTFTGQIAFGAVNLVAHAVTDVDVFVAKLRGSDGSPAWAISLGSPLPVKLSLGVDGAGSVAVDSAGHVAVSANLAGPLDGKASAGGIDAMIASFDAATGATRWTNVYSTAGDDRSFALTYGRNGDVYALVGLSAPFDFGQPIIGAPGPAAVILRLAP